MRGVRPSPRVYVKKQLSHKAVFQLLVNVIKNVTETKAASVKSSAAPSE